MQGIIFSLTWMLPPYTLVINNLQTHVFTTRTTHTSTPKSTSRVSRKDHSREVFWDSSTDWSSN